MWSNHNRNSRLFDVFPISRSIEWRYVLCIFWSNELSTREHKSVSPCLAPIRTRRVKAFKDLSFYSGVDCGEVRDWIIQAVNNSHSNMSPIHVSLNIIQQQSHLYYWCILYPMSIRVWQSWNEIDRAIHCVFKQPQENDYSTWVSVRNNRVIPSRYGSIFATINYTHEDLALCIVVSCGDARYWYQPAD